MEKVEVPRQYADFVPNSTWSRENDCETLILHLPGFNKEQVRILVDTRRQLKIKGERQVKGKGDNQWSRFSKDFLLPKRCDLKGVRAEFDGDSKLLRVTMPRPSPPSPRTAQLTFKAYVLIHYELRKAWERLLRATCGRIDVNGSDSTREGTNSGVIHNTEIKLT